MIQSAQESSVPDAVAKDLTARFVADIEQKAIDKAQEKVNAQLIELANTAEIEALKEKIAAMSAENATINQLLTDSRSQITQLNDAIKAYQANQSMMEQEEDAHKAEHKAEMMAKDEKIRSLEAALAKAESKPAKIIKQPIPSEFEFEPIRGQNGMIEKVRAKTLYRN